MSDLATAKALAAQLLDRPKPGRARRDELAGELAVAVLAIPDREESAVTSGQDVVALAVALTRFAYGDADPDDIPGIVRDHPTHLFKDAVMVVLNGAADQIRDGHQGETSDTVRTDSRADLFVNVAGWMLDPEHQPLPVTDAEIVDATIVANFSGETQCEAPDCGEDVTVALRSGEDEITWVHAYGSDPDHEALVTDEGQERLLIEQVRGWSD